MDQNLAADDLLYRLFHERKVHVLPVKEIVAKCYCSRPRIEQILISFSEEDIKDMILEHQISVTCEFCSETYLFNDSQIGEILEEKKR